MRGLPGLALAGLALLGPGCGLIEQSARVVVTRTEQALNDHTERVRNRKWAEAVWRDLSSGKSQEFSADYESGFREGFAEYLYEGGTGEPAPLPPARYRKSKYQTPRGYAAIEDWFAGYRYGASVAQEGGYRRWVTGPSSLLSGPVPSVELVPDAGTGSAKSPEPVKARELMKPEKLVPEPAPAPRLHLKINQAAAGAARCQPAGPEPSVEILSVNEGH
jgi:hypothetical protein